MADPKTYSQEEVDAIIAERDAIKANRDEALTEAKKAKAALKAWDGKDPAKYEQLLAAAEEAERKKAAAEGDFTKLRDQLVEKHTAERAGDAKRIEKLNRALEQRLVDAQLTAALAKHDADPTMLPLLQLEGRRYVRVRETDDDFEAFVADEKGNPLVADGKGTPMGVDDLVTQTLKTKYPAAFRGSGSSGGGAPKSNAGGGGSGNVFNPATATGDDYFKHMEGLAKRTVTVQGQ